MDDTPIPSRRSWLYDAALILILLAGLYLRLVGFDWDNGQYLHPDERFLMFVESSIQPVQSLAEYFNTAASSLNPHNAGHPLFVYGTWPIFAVRYLLELLGTPGGQVWEIGRPISALVNTATIFVVYLIGVRLYDRRVGLLASAFLAFSVLDIQLSHFFKEDTFMTFFVMLALYFAVRIATAGTSGPASAVPVRADEKPPESSGLAALAELDQAQATPAGSTYLGRQWPWFVLFGVALGMAMASKINALPMALALPGAVAIQVGRRLERERSQAALKGFVYLILGGVTTFLTFRVLQPYAFQGPGFLGVLPNPRWLDNLRELQRLASADSIFGFPPSLQWADRAPVLFAWVNQVRWGLGLPLGLLAWAGFFWMGWRIFRGRWQRHALLWGWTTLYFAWQSTVFNPTMRYQLPVYPTLTLIAAWSIFELWDRKPVFPAPGRFPLQKALAAVLGGFVLVSTAVYAFAFAGIYTRPVTRIAASEWIFENIPGAITLYIQQGPEESVQLLSFPEDFAVQPGLPYTATFSARQSGEVSRLHFPAVEDRLATPGEETLRLNLYADANPGQPISAAAVPMDLPKTRNGEGQPLTVSLDSLALLEEGETYRLEISLESGGTAAYSFHGAALANESTWDDGLPLRLAGYDPYGGIYKGGLNFEMYWEDNPEKRERFQDTLDQADYVLISSSRQWGSVGRLPEHYPLSTAYYRALLGCPDEQSIEHCYNVADVGTYQGKLGFDLVKVFQSDPQLGPLRFNDQPSEEAFTVYDHPKVFIFEKSPEYDSARVAAILEGVNLDRLGTASGDEGGSERDLSLLLPEERLVEQREGGTWTELFRPDALFNQVQVLGVVIWYLSVALLGILIYPLLRLALPGLEDRGYPLARTTGLLVVSYLVWLAGSFRVPFQGTTITAAVLLLGAAGGVAAFSDREALRIELRDRRRYFLWMEALTLGFFLVGLAFRLGNPDLWHPWKGGEKPMDFSYFNAVLKSTSFPPYDPWYAGGYINYYYYGFVLVGVLVKWLGIVPSIAYNLILPTLFALMALGAFSVGWNLVQGRRNMGQSVDPPLDKPDGEAGFLAADLSEPDASADPSAGGLGETSAPPRPLVWAGLPVIPAVAGLAGAMGVAVLGNLGVVRMIVLGYQRLAASGVPSLEEASLLSRFGWTIQGFFKSLSGSSLPYALADWYWLPSRAIPAPNDVEPITEFPFFTFLYADLHAHLIALPLTILVLAWALSVVLARGRWRGLGSGAAGFLLGSMAIGALRPTNTWDFYPYLALGAVAVGYGVWRYLRPPAGWRPGPGQLLRVLAGLAAVGALLGLSHVLYQPYAEWYGQGYNAVDAWQGTRTPSNAYLTHWGVFLFFIVTWMVWETRDWMASTPLSALRKLAPYRGLFQFGLIVFLFTVAALLLLNVYVAWIVLPLAVWTAALLLRPGQPDTKRAVLFFTGTGLLMSLMVEVIVLRGDIGRMNTVFKFYLQVWTLFAVSAAGAMGWLLPVLRRWTPGWRRSWGAVAVFLIGAAALYPALGGLARVKDRMTPEAPRTLDGMAYMAHSSYNDLDTVMDLEQDYQAIRWLQQNVEGSPVIVEGNMVEYHWGSRYSIYTGLPGVLGWNWHQRQQRALLPAEQVTDRVEDINRFYLTPSPEEADAFLDRYDVSYIILGQLERAKYAGEGLSKFEALDGQLWQQVFHTGETTIYRVINSTTAATTG